MKKVICLAYFFTNNVAAVTPKNISDEALYYQAVLRPQEVRAVASFLYNVPMHSYEPIKVVKEGFIVKNWHYFDAGRVEYISFDEASTLIQKFNPSTTHYAALYKDADAKSREYLKVFSVFLKNEDLPQTFSSFKKMVARYERDEEYYFLKLIRFGFSTIIKNNRAAQWAKFVRIIKKNRNSYIEAIKSKNPNLIREAFYKPTQLEDILELL